jgi:hypothetical protein
VTIPSRSICSTILAERLYPILSRRCIIEIDAWPLSSTIRNASS